MKNFKVFLFIFLIFISFSSVYSDVKTDFNIQGGSITDDSLKFGHLWGTIGSNFDILFNDTFFVSPELYFIVIDWGFKNVYLAPGVTANLKFSDIFVGGGFVKLLSLREAGDVEKMLDVSLLKLKLQVGIRSARFILTVFGLMDTNSIFKNMDVGLTMGFTF